jgi:hypothetical protein
VDLGAPLENPEAYKGKRLELTGYVMDYEPARGDAYRTLYFILASGPDDRLPVFASGYTADAIAKASALIGRAYETQEPLTVTGTLKVSQEGETPSRPELRLETVEYAGEKIDVTRGRKTAPGFDVGGWVVTPSIGVGITITP